MLVLRFLQMLKYHLFILVPMLLGLMGLRKNFLSKLSQKLSFHLKDKINVNHKDIRVNDMPDFIYKAMIAQIEDIIDEMEHEGYEV